VTETQLDNLKDAYAYFMDVFSKWSTYLANPLDYKVFLTDFVAPAAPVDALDATQDLPQDPPHRPPSGLGDYQPAAAPL